MAYDKVIDSSVLEANLKSVANAIRTKGGTSANLAFPTGFANAISAIEAGGGNMEKREITFASDEMGASAKEVSILNGNAFIKEHYAKDGFFAVMRAKSITPIAYGVLFLYHGNRKLTSAASPSHGSVLMRHGTTATDTANAGVNGAINGSTWNLGFRATSAGNLNLYMPANRNVGAGTYELYLICEE